MLMATAAVCFISHLPCRLVAFTTAAGVAVADGSRENSLDSRPTRFDPMQGVRVSDYTQSSKFSNSQVCIKVSFLLNQPAV